MRNSLLVSTALASGALLFSLGAKALPIHVGLMGAAGSSEWTSPGVVAPDARTSAQSERSLGTVMLTGWENDDGTWESAVMIQTPGIEALGIQCNESGPNSCTSGQIGSNPPQVIDLDVSHLDGWSSLLITLDSPNGTNTGNLFGAMCNPGDSECEATLVPLGSCTATSGSCTISLSSDLLGDLTNIWIMSADVEEDPISLNGNLYVCTGSGPCTVPTGVPEPKALGIFGFGVLLIGVFVGLRRRRAI